MSSRADPLKEEPGWARNGAGRQFSHKFGYGLMDAERIVDLATKWKSLPSQHICQTVIMTPNAPISDIRGQKTTVRVKTDGCQGTLNSVRFLEHVQCKISLRYYPRGNVQVTLISPSGTRSTLLMPRPRDSFASTYEDWPFLSVHFWGESPQGEWKLEISNMGEDRPTRRGQGLLRKWQLIFYGTEDNPVRLPRSSFTSPVPVRSGRVNTGFFGGFFPFV